MRTMNVSELIEELATKEPTMQVYIGEALLGIETYDELPHERGR